MSASVSPQPRHGRQHWYLELALVAALYAAYDSSRYLVSDGLTRARANGHSLLHIEHWLHLAPERWLNQAFTSHSWIGVEADFAYATLHYAVTPAVLIWLWRRRPAVYRRARTQLGLATVAGLAGFVLFPTAPPRLLESSYGFVDTMAQHASLGWWKGTESVPTGLGSLTNNFAAMPSLHVGWALWCGLMLARHAEDRAVRTLGVLYPVIISGVVMGTANHYLLDCLAGAAVMLLAGLAATPYLRVYGRLREGASSLVGRRTAAPDEAAVAASIATAPAAPHRPAAAGTGSAAGVPRSLASATGPIGTAGPFGAASGARVTGSWGAFPPPSRPRTNGLPAGRAEPDRAREPAARR